MPDLVACYWTVAGPVEIHYGREWSTFDWLDRCDQAARVGFTGIGLWHADTIHQLETRTLAEMAKIFRDAGLKHIEIEFLQDFFRPAGSPEKAESDRLKKLLFEAAAAFDAHHIKAGNIPAATCEFDQLAEALAELCAEAAQHTDAKIAYEIIPSDPQVNTLQAGIELLRQTGRPGNLGLAIDTWHMAKLDIAPDRLRALTRDQLAWVELSDGHFHNLDDFVYEVTCDRRLPGEGEFPIPAYIEALQDAGYPGPWGVEVLSERLRELPIEEAFDRAFETASAQFKTSVA
ncbi:MAG TPA: sugar phosphate isomerase/epimerase [Solirubrobacteraceae bacterium]|jgi:sugar phosphate isomerase/epimerase|nr:sugar phosphate isomerase/epimerase [Solirubrobacteraceae bacterium]